MGLLIFGGADLRTGSVAVANLGSVCIGDLVYYKADGVGHIGAHDVSSFDC